MDRDSGLMVVFSPQATSLASHDVDNHTDNEQSLSADPARLAILQLRWLPFVTDPAALAAHLCDSLASLPFRLQRGTLEALPEILGQDVAFASASSAAASTSSTHAAAADQAAVTAARHESSPLSSILAEILRLMTSDPRLVVAALDAASNLDAANLDADSLTPVVDRATTLLGACDAASVPHIVRFVITHAAELDARSPQAFASAGSGCQHTLAALTRVRARITLASLGADAAAVLARFLVRIAQKHPAFSAAIILRLRSARPSTLAMAKLAPLDASPARDPAVPTSPSAMRKGRLPRRARLGGNRSGKGDNDDDDDDENDDHNEDEDDVDDKASSVVPHGSPAGGRAGSVATSATGSTAATSSGALRIQCLALADLEAEELAQQAGLDVEVASGIKAGRNDDEAADDDAPVLVSGDGRAGASSGGGGESSASASLASPITALDLWCAWAAMLPSTAAATRVARALLGPAVAAITPAVIREALEAAPRALDPFLPAVCATASSALAERERPSARGLGCSIYEALVCGAADAAAAQDAVSRVVTHIGQGASYERDAAFAVLVSVATCRGPASSAQLWSFREFIKSLFDFAHDLRPRHVRSIYDCLYAAAGATGSVLAVLVPARTNSPSRRAPRTTVSLASVAAAADDVDILVRKQLSSPFLGYRRLGVIGVVARLRWLARLASTCDSSDPTFATARQRSLAELEQAANACPLTARAIAAELRRCAGCVHLVEDRVKVLAASSAGEDHDRDDLDAAGERAARSRSAGSASSDGGSRASAVSVPELGELWFPQPDCHVVSDGIRADGGVSFSAWCAGSDGVGYWRPLRRSTLDSDTWKAVSDHVVGVLTTQVLHINESSPPSVADSDLPPIDRMAASLGLAPAQLTPRRALCCDSGVAFTVDLASLSLRNVPTESRSSGGAAPVPFAAFLGTHAASAPSALACAALFSPVLVGSIDDVLAAPMTVLAAPVPASARTTLLKAAPAELSPDELLPPDVNKPYVAAAAARSLLAASLWLRALLAVFADRLRRETAGGEFGAEVERTLATRVGHLAAVDAALRTAALTAGSALIHASLVPVSAGSVPKRLLGPLPPTVLPAVSMAMSGASASAASPASATQPPPIIPSTSTSSSSSSRTTREAASPSPVVAAEHGATVTIASAVELFAFAAGEGVPGAVGLAPMAAAIAASLPRPTVEAAAMNTGSRDAPRPAVGHRVTALSAPESTQGRSVNGTRSSAIVESKRGEADGSGSDDDDDSDDNDQSSDDGELDEKASDAKAAPRAGGRPKRKQGQGKSGGASAPASAMGRRAREGWEAWYLCQRLLPPVPPAAAAAILALPPSLFDWARDGLGRCLPSGVLPPRIARPLLACIAASLGGGAADMSSASMAVTASSSTASLVSTPSQRALVSWLSGVGAIGAASPAVPGANWDMDCSDDDEAASIASATAVSVALGGGERAGAIAAAAILPVVCGPLRRSGLVLGGLHRTYLSRIEDLRDEAAEHQRADADASVAATTAILARLSDAAVVVARAWPRGSSTQAAVVVPEALSRSARALAVLLTGFASAHTLTDGPGGGDDDGERARAFSASPPGLVLRAMPRDLGLLCRACCRAFASRLGDAAALPTVELAALSLSASASLLHVRDLLVKRHGGVAAAAMAPSDSLHQRLSAQALQALQAFWVGASKTPPATLRMIAQVHLDHAKAPLEAIKALVDGPIRGIAESASDGKVDSADSEDRESSKHRDASLAAASMPTVTRRTVHVLWEEALSVGVNLLSAVRIGSSEISSGATGPRRVELRSPAAAVTAAARIVDTLKDSLVPLTRLMPTKHVLLAAMRQGRRLVDELLRWKAFLGVRFWLCLAMMRWKLTRVCHGRLSWPLHQRRRSSCSSMPKDVHVSCKSSCSMPRYAMKRGYVGSHATMLQHVLLMCAGRARSLHDACCSSSQASLRGLCVCRQGGGGLARGSQGVLDGESQAPQCGW